MPVARHSFTTSAMGSSSLRQGMMTETAGMATGHLTSQNEEHRVDNVLQGLRVQFARFRNEQAFVGREKLGWTCKADDPEAAPDKISVGNFDGPSVTVRIARHLAQNPVFTLGGSDHDRRTELGLRQVREGKRNQHYRSD